MKHNDPTGFNPFFQGIEKGSSSVIHTISGRVNTLYDDTGFNSSPPKWCFAGLFSPLCPTLVHPQKAPVSSLLFTTIIHRDPVTVTSGSTPERGIDGDSPHFLSITLVRHSIVIPVALNTLEKQHSRGRSKAIDHTKKPFLADHYILSNPAPAYLFYRHCGINRLNRHEDSSQVFHTSINPVLLIYYSCPFYAVWLSMVKQGYVEYGSARYGYVGFGVVIYGL